MAWGSPTADLFPLILGTSSEKAIVKINNGVSDGKERMLS